MDKSHYLVIKVLDQNNNWYDNAFIENSFDAIQVANFYRNQLGYSVQLWQDEKDVSFLLNSKNMWVRKE